MGKLGFVFEISENLQNTKFAGKKLNKNKLLVFTENKKIRGDYIAGLNHLFKENETKILYLTNDLLFKEYLVFQRANFKYGKISVSQKTCVDYENLTFWFNSDKYRKIRQLLEIDDKRYSLDEIIKLRISDLIVLFN